jgi:hypothetical protein
MFSCCCKKQKENVKEPLLTISDIYEEGKPEGKKKVHFSNQEYIQTISEVKKLEEKLFFTRSIFTIRPAQLRLF